MIRKGSSKRYCVNNLESLTDVDEALYNALLIAHYTLGISSVVMCDVSLCDAAWWLLGEICQGVKGNIT